MNEQNTENNNQTVAIEDLEAQNVEEVTGGRERATPTISEVVVTKLTF